MYYGNMCSRHVYGTVNYVERKINFLVQSKRYCDKCYGNVIIYLHTKTACVVLFWLLASIILTGSIPKCEVRFSVYIVNSRASSYKLMSNGHCIFL